MIRGDFPEGLPGNGGGVGDGTQGLGGGMDRSGALGRGSTEDSGKASGGQQRGVGGGSGKGREDSSATARARAGLPFGVHCCWNGMVAMSVEPLLRGVRIR